MLTFRQKIFISFVIIFLVFAAALFPFSSYFIKRIQEKNLINQTSFIASDLSESSSLEDIQSKVNYLEEKEFLFISIYDPQKHQFLFSSHQEIDQLGLTKEIQEAIVRGKGYDVRESAFFDQKMSFTALPFSFDGKLLIVRTAYPYGRIAALTEDFTFIFLILSTAVLLAFGSIAWAILHYLTRPVQLIIDAIRPFQLGLQEHIPEIKIEKNLGAADEFGRLAKTLNALTKKIEFQIQTLTQERNEKSAILESLEEGVVAVDHQMQTTYVNHMAEVFLGVKKEDILGKTLLLSKYPQYQELIVQAQEKKESMQMVVQTESKPKKSLDVFAVPRGDKGAILVIQDKTSLHKVIELGRDFVANASHELKTPIAVILGFAEYLNDCNKDEISSETYHSITQKIVSNCHRMDTLVKNLLTLAGLDEGLPSSRLQECDIIDLAKQARQTTLAVHPESKIEIEIVRDEPVFLLCDGDLVYQAILNLLDNAVKYSKPPADIKIKVERRDANILISVSDHGIGIPHEELERVFERFYAVDKSRSRSLGGSGLGLSIVERIVGKHQGKIEVESKVGRGTTFTMTFPIREEEFY